VLGEVLGFKKQHKSADSNTNTNVTNGRIARMNL